jgi:hypothetical protein
MSCRRQLLVRLARIAAVRPPRGLPTNKEFLRLSKYFDYLICAAAHMMYLHADMRLKEKALSPLSRSASNQRDTARMTNCWASWKASDYAESEHGLSPSSRCHSMEIRHNRGVGMLTQSVEAAGHFCRFSCALPSYFPSMHRFRGDDLVGALLSVITSEPVFLMRKNVVLRLASDSASRLHGPSEDDTACSPVVSDSVE